MIRVSRPSVSLTARLGLGICLTAVASAQGNPVGAKEPGKWSTVRGKASLVDAISIPPGSILRLMLQDLAQGTRRAVIVESKGIELKGNFPISFELPYNESLIDPTRLYGLAAVVTDVLGQTLAETRVPVRVVTKGNGKRADLALRRPGKPSAPAAEPTAFTVGCEGLRFQVRITGDTAHVRLPERELVLHRVEASYGKKYSDGATILTVFGEAVYIQQHERAYRDCKITSADGK